MKKLYKVLLPVMVIFFSLAEVSCKSSNITDTNGEITVKTSKNNWKKTTTANPISANVFCADPTAVEYEGRLYVYGTNDHEQY